MSTLVSLVALRQLLSRVSSSSQLTLWSMRSLDVNYNLISAKRFSTVINLNGASNNGSHSQGQSKSGQEGKIKSSSLNSTEETANSGFVENTGSSGAENNFVSSSSSWDDAPQTQEILKFLSTLNENSLQSKTMVKLLIPNIAELRSSLRKEKPSNTQDILNSVGMKNLSSCIGHLDHMHSQIEMFGILVLLNAPGDDANFQKVCMYLATNIDKVSSGTKQYFKSKLAVINKENKWESLTGLQNALLGKSSSPGLLAYIKTSLDHETLDSVALDDLLQNLRQRFVEDGENVFKKRESILGSQGIQKLCQVIEGKPGKELTNNSLLNYFEIFQLFQSPQHLQFPLRLIRERLEQKKFSSQEMDILHLIMSKLTPELESYESEIIQNILMGDDAPMSILTSLIETKHQDNFNSQELQKFILHLRQVLTREGNLSKHSKIAAIACMEILGGAIDQEIKTKNISPSRHLLENSLQIFELLNFPQSHPAFHSVTTLMGKDLNSNSFFRDQSRMENVPAKFSKSRTESLVKTLFEFEIENEQEEKDDVEEKLPVGLKELCQEIKSAETVTQFQKCLLAILDQIEDLEYEEARQLLWNVADYLNDCSPTDSNILKEKVTILLNSIFKILIQNINQMKAKTIEVLLSKCAKNARRDHFEFYNQDFVEVAINKALAIGDESTLMKLVPSVRLLTHFNPRFIEVVSDAFIKRFTHDPDMASNMLQLLAIFDYTPRQWDTLKEILLNHNGIISNSTRSVSYTIDFLALNVLSEELFNTIFDPNKSDQLEEWLTLHAPRQSQGEALLLLIYHYLKEFYPDYKGPFPSPTLMDNWETIVKKKTKENMHLVNQMAILKGPDAFGPDFVLTGIYHKGVIIDHCVALRPDGSPIRIKECQNLENINVEGGSLILLKFFGGSGYTNTGVLRPINRLIVQLMETFDYPFIELNSYDLFDLPITERGTWLKKQVLREHENNMKKRRHF